MLGDLWRLWRQRDRTEPLPRAILRREMAKAVFRPVIQRWDGPYRSELQRIIAGNEELLSKQRRLLGTRGN